MLHLDITEGYIDKLLFPNPVLQLQGPTKYYNDLPVWITHLRKLSLFSLK